MVVQEGPTQYRLVGMENGKLTNRVQQDARGLSAADILYQTTVVTVQPSAAPTK
jgi:hypothetical protein